MPHPAALSPDSLEYQLTVLHIRQNGFLPPPHRILQHKYREFDLDIINVVENTYTGILTVVLGKPSCSWSDELGNAISREAGEGAAVLQNPEVRFGSFSVSENEG